MGHNDLMPREHYKNLADIEDTYWWHQGKVRAALSFLIPCVKKRRKVIHLSDIGCGTGGFLKQLKKALSLDNAIGLDGSEEALKATRKRGLDVQFANFNEPYTINADLSDIITCMDVLEHIENEDNFLRNIYDNLLPDGVILINVPAYNFLFSSWDKVSGHKRRYNTGHLAGILKRNNFRVIKITYLFSYIFLIAVFRRLLGPGYMEKTCVFPRVSNFTNNFLLLLTGIEAFIIRFVRIPFGTSVLCIAKKCQ